MKPLFPSSIYICILYTDRANESHCMRIGDVAVERIYKKVLKV